jgi:Holliday junction resolvase RusA-like endonuclease
MKLKLKIKPLSVNDAWRGRRFKSQKYKLFEKTVLLMLPNYPKKIRPPKLGIKFMYYFSNASSDIDNPTKPIIDILSKKY